MVDYWAGAKRAALEPHFGTVKQNTRILAAYQDLLYFETDVLSAVAQVMLVRLRRHDGVISTTTLSSQPVADRVEPPYLAPREL